MTAKISENTLFRPGFVFYIKKRSKFPKNGFLYKIRFLRSAGYRIHVNTTRKYLAKNEYYAFRPRRKPYLTKIYKKERLRWA